MEPLMEYIKPELLVVVVVLYIVGMGLKKAATVKDNYIPYILTGLGILLCTLWVLATSQIATGQDVAMAIFTAVVQGVLAAGASVYTNQIIKQRKKAA